MKPLHDYIFRPVDGIWTELHENAGVLADVLGAYGFNFDSRVQFARMTDYDAGLYFLYHSSAGKVHLEIYEID